MLQGGLPLAFPTGSPLVALCLLSFQQGLVSLGPRLTCCLALSFACQPLPLGTISQRQREEAAGILKAGCWGHRASGGAGPLWPLAFRPGEGVQWPGTCVSGKLAWRQWWEIEFPAHLGGSCGPAFVARLVEPSQPRVGGPRAHFLLLNWKLSSWWHLGTPQGGQPPPAGQRITVLWTSLQGAFASALDLAFGRRVLDPCPGPAAALASLGGK